MNVMARRLVAVLLGLFLLTFVSCTKKDTSETSKGGFKVGLVLDKGGRDDKSFNAAAFRGATEAEKKLGITLKVVEASDDTAIEPSLRTFATKGYDLIIAIGFVMGDGVSKVAKEFPNVPFALIDSEANLPNVRSILFQEHEGCFLVGALAALTTKAKAVGFVGGMDIPLIRRFELGYKAGAESQVKGIQVITNYVGTGSEAWRNPTKAKELALSQYQKGVDIIFAAGGASNLGVFDAAEEKGKFAIGVDSNQNWVKPGRILTSMVKKVDVAVYDAIDKKIKGAFQAGTVRLGLSDGGIDFAIDEFNRKLVSPEIEKKVLELKNQIISKKIIVPDYYEIHKK